MPTERAHDVAGASADIPARRVAAPAEPPQTLPVDLQLEIVARTNDTATVLRCAAASRSLRRAILEPGFLRALALRAAASGGFHPAHLVAVSYRVRECGDGPRTDTVVVHTSRPRLPFDAGLLRSFDPAASRDGRVVLWRGPRIEATDVSEVELLVCDAFTGHVTPLPCMDDRDEIRRAFTVDVFHPALLAVDDGASRGSFELLVMHQLECDHPMAQIFSSQEGEWGDLREIRLPQHVWLREATSTAPAVIGRTIHWLCFTRFDDCYDPRLTILVLHAEAVQATVIELPEGCRTHLNNYEFCWTYHRDDNFILAVAADGTSLGLVAAQTCEISMWILSPDEGPSSSRWRRQMVIPMWEIDGPLTDGSGERSGGVHFWMEGVGFVHRPNIRFDGSGERSGVVLFWMEGVGLVQLNLGTKKALVLRRCTDDDHVSRAKAVLHEIDLVPLLQAMKNF